MGLLKKVDDYKTRLSELDFSKIELTKAYKMIKSPALVATKGEKFYDLTPYGWIMPMDYEPVTKVIFSSDPCHQAVANIRRTKEFAVCCPIDFKESYFNLCGTVSNPDFDKFMNFKIPSDSVSLVDVKVPKEKLIGWIEFRLLRMIEEGSIVLVLGEAVAAYAKKDGVLF